MYIGVDIGASKTLLAMFDEQAKIVKQNKFDTDKKAPVFLEHLQAALTEFIGSETPTAMAVAVPGAADRESGVIKIVTNLDWGELNLFESLKSFNMPITVDNDCNLATLSEAKMGAGQGYGTVLYATISTGVNTGLVVEGKIVLPRSEGGQMIQQYDSSGFKRFEDLVGGPDFIERFGKPGYEVSDPKIWQTYAQDLAVGLFNAITILGPDVVVLGGGMSVHFDLFIEPLKAALNRFNDKLWYPTPPVVQAKNVETAVIYGCYLAAKELAQ